MSTIAERGNASHKLCLAAPREAFLDSLPSRSVRQDGNVTPLHVALVNNMPDIALSRTELQFMEMLQQAAGDVPIRLSLYSLPVIPRGERGRQHLAASYRPIDDLWRNPPDAIVISGTEPRETNLRDEQYWAALTSLIDWADAAGLPAMFSCLAAHVAVLHCDGILRSPLAAKCFGVFDHDVDTNTALTRGIGQKMWLPHTRWNQVSEAALVAGGYQVLSRSDSVGVGYFAKQRRASWLFCQGHPEYDGKSLFREYRRDVLRFLRQEREAYPDLPRDYFAEPDTRRFEAFRAHALAIADESAMRDFPADVPPGPKWDVWRGASIEVTRNWLKTVATPAWADAG